MLRGSTTLEELKLFEENGKAFVGKEHEDTSGSVLMGRLAGKESQGKRIYLDTLSPHVISICGARGSGKSYSLGVIAEEITSKNPAVGVVIVDPIGVFWSMKYKNNIPREVEELSQWGLTPKSLSNIRVLVPLGLKQRASSGTYDGVFSIKPSELSTMDWCLTFDFDRFGPQGLLLDHVLKKLSGKDFGLEEITAGIIEEEQGEKFKRDTVRALFSRISSAESWGVFDKKGTTLSDISTQGKICVIDISFLESRVGALIVGILARKILESRKISTRNQAASELGVAEAEEALFDRDSIPQTWLFIDEAHTLVPPASKTPASEALIEYVKQGRRPGCSLVVATQQPSAIDSKVLSQLDILLCHRLVFDDDIKAVVKRMPSPIPKAYSNKDFIKSLPAGVALLGDRSVKTSRSFCIKIRPRETQHEGRELLPQSLPKPYEKLAKEHGKPDSGILEMLEAELGSSEKPQKQDFGQHRPKDVFPIEVFEQTMGVSEAKKQALKNREKKFFGLVGQEKVESVALMYSPIWRAEYKAFLGEKTAKGRCYVDAVDGELLGVKKGRLVSSKNLFRFMELNEVKRRIMYKLIRKQEVPLGELSKRLKMPPDTLKANIIGLIEKGYLGVEKDKKHAVKLRKRFIMPSSIFEDTLILIQKKDLQRLDVERDRLISPRINEKYVEDVLGIYQDNQIIAIDMVFKPVWLVTYVGRNKHRRTKTIPAA